MVVDDDDDHAYAFDLANAARHTSTLVRAAADRGNEQPPRLCRYCVERLDAAIRESTERLERECRAYEDKVEKEEEEAANRARERRAETDDDSSSRVVSDLVAEVDDLRFACRAEEERIDALARAVELERRRTDAIAREEDEVLADAAALEMLTERSRDSVRALAHECERARTEAERAARIRPAAALFDLRLPDNEHEHDASRCPTVNGLRLAHRPRGDLGWREIGTAWSAAARLLSSVVGCSLDHSFQNDLRIVPLAGRARLIEVRTVDGDRREMIRHDLSVDFVDDDADATIAPGLVALHRLLVRLTSEDNDDDPATTTTAGRVDPSRLDERDDASWRRVVDDMARDMDRLLKRRPPRAVVVVGRAETKAVLADNSNDDDDDDARAT